MLDTTGKEVRLLTASDGDAVAAIILSRKKIGAHSAFEHSAAFAAFMRQENAYENGYVLGLFDNGVLDAFVIVDFPEKKGYDGPLTGIPSFTATMARAGRVKTAAGRDLNHTILMNGNHDTLVAQKRYENWTLMPKDFEGHVDNPDIECHAKQMWEWAEPPQDIPAGEWPTGPNADFVKTHLMAGVFPEIWSIRHMRLKEEFRT